MVSSPILLTHADLSQISSIPVSVIIMISLDYGLGLHIWDQKAEWQPTYGKVMLILPTSRYKHHTNCTHTDVIYFQHTLLDIQSAGKNLSLPHIHPVLPVESQQTLLYHSHRFYCSIHHRLHIPCTLPVSTLTTPCA